MRSPFHIPLFQSLLLPAVMMVFISACSATKEVTEPAYPTESTQTEENTAQTAAVAEQDQKEAERRARLEELYQDELRKEYKAKANTLTTYYILAQQQYFKGQFKNAFYLINKAAKVKETSDVLALKGNIYLALSSKEKFAENWRKALEMDDDIILPTSTAILRELRNQGLINANFKRNF
jgi:tetratricopeptide (TPR) repeat protein